MVDVRRAHAKDAETIAFMMEAANLEDGLPGPGLTAETVRAQAFGPAPLFDAWVAVDAETGEPVGCAIANKGYDVRMGCGAFVISLLYVAPHERRAGNARRLIAAAAERAREVGARTMRVSVSQSNDIAREFFQAMGATEHHVSVFKLGQDQIEWLAEENA